MMPDFSNPQNILHMNDNKIRVGTYKLFTAPSNGYIRAVDCWTKVGYFLSINSPITQDNKTARIKSVYHKCASTAGSTGMFLINKGDVLYFYKGTDFNGLDANATTDIVFYPGVF